MYCPYCDEELTYIDYYGGDKDDDTGALYGYPYFVDPTFEPTFDPLSDLYLERDGEIFKCENLDCIACETHFYTNKRGTLREGFPSEKGTMIYE